MTETFTDFIDRVTKVAGKYPAWRLGQVYFHVLHGMNPDLAAKVQGTAYDPFYVDARIEQFLLYVARNWSARAAPQEEADKPEP